LPVLSSLPEEGDAKGIWIVDTPPLLDASEEAIRTADVLVVPIGLWKHAVHGLNRVMEIRGKRDMRVIINEWCGGLAQQKAEAYLISEGFDVVGRLRRYLRIGNNIDSHSKWNAGLLKKQAEAVICVLLKVFNK
jgi:hypothetical protein